MTAERFRLYAAEDVLDRAETVRAAAGRAEPASPDSTPGGPPQRHLWCRLDEGAPADPPDERYWADEVRPAGVDEQGRVTWEAVPGGLAHAVLHNVAEAADAAHRLAAGTVVRAEERLDRREPPEFVLLAHAPPSGGDGPQLARVVSWDEGTYTVQPVRRTESGFVDEGDEIGGVPNLGELWPEEAGYLAGPGGFDRYVQILETPGGPVIVLHPPRLA
jgi:hypothetical protein